MILFFPLPCVLLSICCCWRIFCMEDLLCHTCSFEFFFTNWWNADVSRWDKKTTLLFGCFKFLLKVSNQEKTRRITSWFSYDLLLIECKWKSFENQEVIRRVFFQWKKAADSGHEEGSARPRGFLSAPDTKKSLNLSVVLVTSLIKIKTQNPSKHEKENITFLCCHDNNVLNQSLSILQVGPGGEKN